MDSSLSNSSVSGSTFTIANYAQNSKYSSDALIVEKTLSNRDAVDINFQDKYKTLNVTAQEIVKKLNEMLAAKLPDGIESLKQEDYTADATSTRIVQGATAFFGVYAEQHPELSQEEQLDKFMETIKSGIQKGYDEAFNTLKGLGAFDLDGIQGGVEQTKILIDQKLEAFYQAKRKELGLESKDTQVQEATSTEVLKQAGSKAINLVA